MLNNEVLNFNLQIEAEKLTKEQKLILSANIGEVLENARQTGLLTAFFDCEIQLEYVNVGNTPQSSIQLK